MNIEHVYIEAGDTYHNRHSPDSPYKGNKKYKKLPNKCSTCGTTDGPFDLHHTSNNRKDLKSGKGLKVMCRSCHRKMHAKMNGGKGSEDIAIIRTSLARVLDDPQDKEGQAIAKTHQNADLMYVDFILCNVNTNKNKDTFTKEDLSVNACTAINKPINEEHTLKNIGVIYASKFVDVEKLNNEEKETYSSLDVDLSTSFVYCRGVIWEYKHPKEARAMRKQYANKNLRFSMENAFELAECSQCSEKFTTSFEYCDHLLERRAEGSEWFGTSRIFHNSNFVGAGHVKRPGDPGAKGLAIAASHVVVPILPYFITTEDYKSFVSVAGDFNMKKKEVPAEFTFAQEGFDGLADEQFADNINRAFPIDNEANIVATAKVLLNKEIAFYDKAEQIYVLTRLSEAAKAHELDLSEYIEGGNNDMDKAYKTKEEFEIALREAIASEVEKVQSGAKLKEVGEELGEANKKITSLNTEISDAKVKAEEVENAFAEFKTSIEKEKETATRYDSLVKAGLEFADSDKIKKAIHNMDEEAFSEFKSILSEAAEKKELTPEEKKKLEEEKKKLEKDKKKKGSKDIVAESQEANAAVNTVDDDEPKESFPGEWAIDAVING